MHNWDVNPMFYYAIIFYVKSFILLRFHKADPKKLANSWFLQNYVLCAVTACIDEAQDKGMTMQNRWTEKLFKVNISLVT